MLGYFLKGEPWLEAGSEGKGEDRNPSSSGAGKFLTCLEKESPTTEGKITSLKIEESVFAVVVV